MLKKSSDRVTESFAKFHFYAHKYQFITFYETESYKGLGIVSSNPLLERYISNRAILTYVCDLRLSAGIQQHWMFHRQDWKRLSL